MSPFPAPVLACTCICDLNCESLPRQHSGRVREGERKVRVADAEGGVGRRAAAVIAAADLSASGRCAGGLRGDKVRVEAERRHGHGEEELVGACGGW